jgi:hypothetical protein
VIRGLGLLCGDEDRACSPPGHVVFRYQPSNLASRESRPPVYSPNFSRSLSCRTHSVSANSQSHGDCVFMSQLPPVFFDCQGFNGNQTASICFVQQIGLPSRFSMENSAVNGVAICYYNVISYGPLPLRHR